MTASRVGLAAAKNVHLNRLINIISQRGLFWQTNNFVSVCKMNIIKVNYNWEKPRANISTAGAEERYGERRKKRKEVLLSLFEGVLVVR